MSVATIRHVAGKAGCSIAPVSHVVNSTGPASPAVQSANQLAYEK